MANGQGDAKFFRSRSHLPEFCYSEKAYEGDTSVQHAEHPSRAFYGVICYSHV